MSEPSTAAVEAQLAKLPGMTTRDERRYLYQYASEEYSGAGQIVDLGCWLGSTAAPLAAGLQRNSRPAAAAKLVHAYDFFRYDADMEADFARAGMAGRYRQGELFLDAFEENVRPWGDRIKPIIADLQHESWSGGPIEMLFIDAMKNWELTNGILRGFFPSLVPGLSLVAHQDYAHFYTPWIALVMYRLRDSFTPVRHIAGAGTMIFRLTAPIPSECIQETYTFATFSDEEVDKAFDYALECVSERDQVHVAGARVMVDVHQGKLGSARSRLASLIDQFGYEEGLVRHVDAELSDPRFAALEGTANKHVRSWCFRFAKEQYTGRGAIVELGSRLACLTIPLAEGLAQNVTEGVGPAVVHAVDDFLYDPAAAVELHLPSLEGRWKAGDSFLPEFHRRIQSWNNRIVVHSNVDDFRWTSEPIDLLLLGILHSWRDAEAVGRLLAALLPHLVPDRSTVVVRDVLLIRDWSVAMLLYTLRDMFDRPRFIEHSSSAILRCRASATAAIVERCSRPRDWSLREWCQGLRHGVELALGVDDVAGWRAAPWFGEATAWDSLRWRLDCQAVWKLEMDPAGQITSASLASTAGDPGENTAWVGRGIDDWADHVREKLEDAQPRLGGLPFPCLDLKVEQPPNVDTDQPAHFIQMPKVDAKGRLAGYLLFAAMGPVFVEPTE